MFVMHTKSNIEAAVVQSEQSKSSEEFRSGATSTDDDELIGTQSMERSKIAVPIMMAWLAHE
jgi:hypothetical protein